MVCRPFLKLLNLLWAEAYLHQGGQIRVQ